MSNESLTRACSVRDVAAGEMLPFDVDGFPPLAIYNLDGIYYATSNICTHQVALLTDGYFEGDIVECPLHGGAFNMRTGEACGVDEEGRAQGFRLACQSAARGDCRITLRPKPDYIPVHAPRRMTARLVERIDLTADMAEFRFKGEGSADFLPGQFAMLRFTGVTGARAYSMCNLPNDQAIWAFIIKRVPGGAGTGALFDTATIGDSVTLEGPFGMAFLRTDPPRDVVCIGGGSGLSPMLSIARGAARDPAFDGREIRFFYGGRTVGDLCVQGLLDAEPILAERVDLVTAISDVQALANATWTGERGFIHDVVARHLGPDPAASDYYFCGPPAMTDAVHKMLMLEHRVPARQLHFDRFY